MLKITTNNIPSYAKSYAYSAQSFKASTDQKAMQARELEMIPKYLEVAKINGGYRFKNKEIIEISKNFKFYATNLSTVDLLKELLAVGTEVKNPLSAQEIIGFLQATTSMKMLEQMNVLEFLKTAKIQEKKNITPEYIKETYPYEAFKAKEIKMAEKMKNKSKSNWLSEENIKKRYEHALKNRINIFTNENLRKILLANKCPVSEYILQNNKPVVSTIAKSIDPKMLYFVLEETGVSPSILTNADTLVKLYKMSGQNKALIVDLTRAFYPAEIKQIFEVLNNCIQKTKQDTLPELKNYTENTYKVYDNVSKTTSTPSLPTQRRNVLKALNLKNEIKLLPLEEYQDAFSMVYSHNFEGGKKR